LAEIVRAVSIGEITVSDHADEVLVAYGLGSCVAICLYDPVVGVGGMQHALLPSAPKTNGANNNSAKYVDKGLPLLIESLLRLGAAPARLVVNMCGGAQVLTIPGFGNEMNIGQRNVQAADAILQAAGLRVKARDTGGHNGRTVRFYISSGQITVKTLGQGEQVLA
jgi:chemotaxis protein CheD